MIGVELLIVLAKMISTSLLPDTGGEVKESMIAMFLLVYIADFSQRVLAQSQQIETEEK